MAQAIEWFQCKKCGRRQRWSIEIAGRDVPCACGATVRCPEGPRLGGLDAADTQVEFAASMPASVDPAGAADPRFADLQRGASEAEEYLSPAERERRRLAGKRFLIWTIMMLIGLALLIHAIITQWRIYIALTVLFAPVSFWMFLKTKRAFQRGKGFWTAVGESLGS